MSESDNLAIVQQLYAAIAQREYSQLTPLFADEIQWYGLTLDQEIKSKFLQDVQSIIEFFEMRDQVLESQWITETLIPQGDRIIVIGKTHHTSKITNYCFEDKWVHILTLRQGKIAEFHHYLDPLTLMGVAQ